MAKRTFIILLKTMSRKILLFANINNVNFRKENKWKTKENITRREKYIQLLRKTIWSTNFLSLSIIMNLNINLSFVTRLKINKKITLNCVFTSTTIPTFLIILCNLIDNLTVSPTCSITLQSTFFLYLFITFIKTLQQKKSTYSKYK